MELGIWLLLGFAIFFMIFAFIALFILAAKYSKLKSDLDESLVTIKGLEQQLAQFNQNNDSKEG